MVFGSYTKTRTPNVFSVKYCVTIRRGNMRIDSIRMSVSEENSDLAASVLRHIKARRNILLLRLLVSLVYSRKDVIGL